MGDNVAICLCGQMRTFRKCSQSINQNLIKPLDADVFIHTWSKSGGSTKENKGDTGIEITEEMLFNEYGNCCNVKIEQFKSQYYKKLGQVEIPNIVIKKEPVHYKGTIPNFYSIYQCNKLRLEFDRKYDLVIKLRPDMYIGGTLPAKVRKSPNKLWSSGHKIDPTIQVSDKFVVANNEVFNYYATVWDKLNDYWDTMIGNENYDSFVGERLLKYHLDSSEFSYGAFYIPNTYILRSDGTKF